MNLVTSMPTDKAEEPAELRASRCLGDLIRVCRSGEDTYRSAAERCGSEALRGPLMDRSHQRAGFTSALQTLQARHADGRVEDGASMMRRAWNELREALVPASDEKILAELEGLEDSALQTYQDILEDFPSGLYPTDAAVISFHLREIGRNRDTLREWETALPG